MITRYLRKQKKPEEGAPCFKESASCEGLTTFDKVKRDCTDRNTKDDIPRKLRKTEQGIVVNPSHTLNSNLSKKPIEDIHNILNRLCLEARPTFKDFSRDHLSLQYAKVFEQKIADLLFQTLEASIDYNVSSKVKIFGKVYDVPRKQTAYGDEGFSYTFSNVTIDARKWIPCLIAIKSFVEYCCQCKFNFVLINRYENGQQYMGEHKDDEKDLAPKSSIASLSLGQQRDFIFRHQDARGSKKIRKYEPLKLVLEHGSLLIMEHPTNNYWYHCLPKRSIDKAPLPRINLTFRRLLK